MKVNYKNKVVLVTGGSRGIGKEIALSFYRNGAKVYITCTKKENTIKKQRGDNFIKSFIVDFSDERKFQSFLSEVNEIKKIDILINNAGINKIGKIQNYSKKNWDEVQNINLRTPFILTQAISKKMIKNKFGRIVNIASIFGEISKSKRAAYSASKFGLIGLTKAVALDLASNNILVNSVSPGFVETDLTKKILTANEIKDLSKQVPLGRLANPKEICELVLFLTSENNSYITAQNIIIDGGFSAT